METGERNTGQGETQRAMISERLYSDKEVEEVSNEVKSLAERFDIIPQDVLHAAFQVAKGYVSTRLKADITAREQKR